MINCELSQPPTTSKWKSGAHLVMLVALIALASGCASHRPLQPEDLVVLKQPVVQPEQWVSRAEIDEDIQTLLFALEKAYAGTRYPMSSSALRATRAQLSAIASGFRPRPRSRQELCNEIAQTLSQVPDKHLSVVLNGKRCGNPASYEPRVGENLAEQADQKVLLSSRLVKDQRVAVLSLADFEDPNHELQAGSTVDNRIKAILSQSSAAVLDMRGNSGGYAKVADYWRDIFNRGPLKEKQQDKPSISSSIDNMESVALKLNSITSEHPEFLNDSSMDSEGQTQFIQSYFKFQNFLKTHDLPLAYQAPEEKSEEEKKRTSVALEDSTAKTKDPSFVGPLFLIIDKGCASACEDLLQAVEDRPNTWTAGQRTSGAIHYTDPGLLVLRKSGIQVKIPLRATLFADGRMVEKVGYEPKIKVDDGTDAVEFVLKKWKDEWSESLPAELAKPVATE